MIAKNATKVTPATLCKHFDLVRGKFGAKVIFLAAIITSFNRRRLIEYKVPFIIPQNQMYLPDMAIDLREHFIQIRSKSLHLGPAAQVVMLFMLSREVTGPVTPMALTKKLRYSKMSMSRAIYEIEGAKLATVEIEGRKRLAHFDQDRRDLWEKSLTYLKTPVKKTVWLASVEDTSRFHEAGLSALSHYSMLAPPKQPVYAVGTSQWQKIKENLQLSKFSDEAECQLEIWSYPPDLLAKDNDHKVDPLSLYLSLKDVDDERVISAMEQMMESIKW